MLNVVENLVDIKVKIVVSVIKNEDIIMTISPTIA